MRDSPWGDVIGDVLAGRTSRPRSTGITMVIDKGLGPVATADLLDIAGDHIDHWKLSFGTSALVPRLTLERKLRLLADHGILTYPGGTLLEAAIVQRHCRDYMEQAARLGISAVEVSDGTIPLPLERRRAVIECAREAGLQVITEVGKKDPGEQPPPAELARQALADIEAGAEFVIIEARESGLGVGIYDAAGAIRSDVLEPLVADLGEAIDRIVWEAPLRGQQAGLIRRFGPNVNLGNIAPTEVLALEALRHGLRFETFRPVAEQLTRTQAWDPGEPESPPVRSGSR